MIEIYFKGNKLFEYEDENVIQIVGRNIKHISLITEIYHKIFSGYRFTDIDIEAMNGYYPEVKKDGQTVKNKDLSLIKLSNINDLISELGTNKNSIFMKYILSFKDNILLNEILLEIEDKLLEFSLLIDELIREKIHMENLNIKSNLININVESIIKNFIEINFVRLFNKRIPTWLLSEQEVVDLFINLIILIINEGEAFTVIIDKMDSKMDIIHYRNLVRKLYKLAEENSNLKIWIIPSIEKGVFLDYKIFKDTYIINDEIIRLGDFTTTYESICRNYPDNNLPREKEVLKSLLQVLPFYDREYSYHPTKEIVIASIFNKLLGEEENIKIKVSHLSKLEKNFLTIVD